MFVRWLSVYVSVFLTAFTAAVDPPTVTRPPSPNYPQVTPSGVVVDKDLYGWGDKFDYSNNLDCWKISDISEQWFWERMVPYWKDKPLPNTLFYTEQLSTEAIKCSRRESPYYQTLWELWPCQYYDLARRSDNPLRCILSSRQESIEYFSIMSRSMAMRATDRTTVMHRREKSDTTKLSIPPNGIWYSVEWPALKNDNNPLGCRVDEVHQLAFDETKDPPYESFGSKMSRPFTGPVPKRRWARHTGVVQDANQTTKVDESLKTLMSREEDPPEPCWPAEDDWRLGIYECLDQLW